ncbi:MAG: hypothetical protein A4E23_00009 [Methanomethylovorans sp. PtaU1.Bin073]|jgi:hypothetical protein|nr:MAG: hypothetical protein A4E23_00009 [Methanomethylovorans sp. PtaU1.Bin073]
MDDKLRIGFTVANAYGDFDVTEVYDELEKRLQCTEISRFDKTSDSSIRGGAIDYSVWVPVAFTIADSLISIASNIYDIYTSKILPYKEKNKGIGLYVSVGPEHETNFMLGDEYIDKNSFVKDFKLKVISQTETRCDGTITTTSTTSLDIKSK